MLANDMKASPEFSEASRQISSVWDQASLELRTAIRAAFDQAADRQASYVNKLHLLLALLKDGRVRSHVTLAERDINKIELLITEKLRISGPHFDQNDGATLSNSPKWGSDFLAVLSDAANKKKHYRHPTIDVWLVFDLLACDADLKGNFTYSRSGYANDHDVRINELSELTKDRQAEVNQLKSDIRDLELANQRLKAELDQTRAEFKALSAEFAQVRQQLVKLPVVEQRLGHAEQTTGQLVEAYSYIRGTQDSNAALMNALLSNIRTVQPATAPAPTPPEPVASPGWFGRKRRLEPAPAAVSTAVQSGPVVIASPSPQTASAQIHGIPSVKSATATLNPTPSPVQGLPPASGPQLATSSAGPVNGIKQAAPSTPQSAANGASNITAKAAQGGAPPSTQAAKPLAMAKT